MEIKKIKIILAVVITGIVSPVAFMAMDNKWPYEYYSGEVHPDPAKLGTQAQVLWRVKVNRICYGFVQRQIVDSRGVIHNYDPVPAAGNVAANFWISFTLPLDLPKGPSIYRARGTYWCNPLQRLFPLKTLTPDIHFTLE